MSKASENTTSATFRRAFRGYKKKNVDEYIARLEQEHAVAEENYQGRIALLVQENEHAAQMLRALQEEKERLLSDCDEYRKQLKDSSSTVQMLYDRLDLLGSETERLQNTVNELKKNAPNTDLSSEDWKQRALTAEETVRRFAEAEMKADAEREHAHHIRLPFGKKAYLDMTLRKDDKNV